MDANWHLDPQLAEDTHPLASFELSDLRLMDDANYPWLVLVPRVAGARELIDLPGEARLRLMHEIDHAARVLKQVHAPYKLNVAALGNMVEQLHVHLIARDRSDPAWPAPVWGRVARRPYSPEQLAETARRLQAALAAG
ncbi:HIT domain-containing protein [Alkalisalibacterium limincola]|uniref:HIT family protein n=1 Tax=Alkalisalibacterium limincola TaxID=2699169 RepID=A0A5C8KPH4_9GAMM|nr:HIT family protein [Alkalisalibacterium limincola]TXK62044.1 HIT family protein [Alkalisalibacterium limincola]